MGLDLAIACEKMSLHWPGMLCNGMLWMVLGLERVDPVRRLDELRKGGQGSNHNSKQQPFMLSYELIMQM